MPPRLLILGGSGFVGGWLGLLAARQGREVWLASRSRPPGWDGAWIALDITAPEMLADALDEAAPGALVNAAAISAVDQAEREPEAAWLLNATAAERVAAACAARGIQQLFFSTDAVFSGENGPYREGDPTGPVNAYGRTKAAAEAAVLAADPRAVVLRVSLILGFPALGGSSYLADLDEKLARGQVVTTTPEETRSPIAVQNLCAAVLELLDTPHRGFLHLGSIEAADRLTLARSLARALGRSPELVQPPLGGPPPPGRARRHQRGVLDVRLAQSALRTPQLKLEDTIALAVQRPDEFLEGS